MELQTSVRKTRTMRRVKHYGRILDKFENKPKVVVNTSDITFMGRLKQEGAKRKCESIRAEFDSLFSAIEEVKNRV